jgi:hypothetical protein
MRSRSTHIRFLAHPVSGNQDFVPPRINRRRSSIYETKNGSVQGILSECITFLISISLRYRAAANPFFGHGGTANRSLGHAQLRHIENEWTDDDRAILIGLHFTLRRGISEEILVDGVAQRSIPFQRDSV